MTKLQKYNQDNEFRRAEGIYCVVRKFDKNIFLEDVAKKTALEFIKNLDTERFGVFIKVKKRR